MCKKYIFLRLKEGQKADIYVYKDEGYSGKDTDRPQFQKMMNDNRKKPFDYIVCYKLDRISRSVSDCSALIKELNRLGTSFICIKENCDTSTPMGRAMMNMAAVFAELERETIAERVRDNMIMLAKRGRWLGGTTPFGFTSEKTQQLILDGKVKYSCRLKSNPDEIKIVKTIYDKYLELNSISGVSKYLIKENVKSRNGKFFCLLGIKEILQNPVYCIADKDARDYFIRCNSDVCFEEHECSNKLGLLSYNKRDYTKKNAPRHSKDQWIISMGKHRGIIPGKIWVKVQQMLENNKPSPLRVKPHNNYSLLSGMIYCTKCGNKMFAKRRSYNKILFDYICNSKMRGGLSLCNCQNLNGLQTDDLVYDYLKDYTKINFDACKQLERLKQNYQNEINSDPIKEIDAKIRQFNRRIGNLVKTLSCSELDPSFVQYVNKEISNLDKDIKNLKDQKQRMQKNLNMTSNSDIQIDVISETLSSFKENFDSLTINEKRNLIRLLIKRIEWDGQNLHIFIYDQ